LQQSINNLILELETGGNIRLEDGKPTDVWHSSCVDLVQSRFFPQDYRAFNVAGVKVTRVHRVHNRFLRNRFDARLESLVDITDSSYKKSLEYLFYGEIPDTQSLQTIMEDGFPAAEAYAELGMDSAVPLSNSWGECGTSSARAARTPACLRRTPTWSCCPKCAPVSY
jgi:hypothetical protein